MHFIRWFVTKDEPYLLLLFLCQEPSTPVNSIVTSSAATTEPASKEGCSLITSKILFRIKVGAMHLALLKNYPSN